MNRDTTQLFADFAFSDMVTSVPSATIFSRHPSGACLMTDRCAWQRLQAQSVIVASACIMYVPHTAGLLGNPIHLHAVLGHCMDQFVTLLFTLFQPIIFSECWTNQNRRTHAVGLSSRPGCVQILGFCGKRLGQCVLHCMTGTHSYSLSRYSAAPLTRLAASRMLALNSWVERWAIQRIASIRYAAARIPT